MTRVFLIDVIFAAAFFVYVAQVPELLAVGLISALLFLTVRLLGTYFHIAFWVLAVPVFLLWPNPTRATIILGSLAYYAVHALFAYEARHSRRLENRLVKVEQLNSQYLQQMDVHRKLEEEMRYASRLEERNELSQRIHDLVGHNLSGALLQLELANRLLDQDPAKAQDLLLHTTEIIRSGTEEIRLVLRDAQPEAREVGISRLKSLLDDFQKRTEIRTNLLTTGMIEKVRPIHWTVLSANLQEALTNTAKHSNAHNLTCRLDVLAQRIRFTVEDDGIGGQLTQRGMGLRGMEERAARLGGVLLTDGSKGMRITTLLPLEGDFDD